MEKNVSIPADRLKQYLQIVDLLRHFGHSGSVQDIIHSLESLLFETRKYTTGSYEYNRDVNDTNVHTE